MSMTELLLQVALIDQVTKPLQHINSEVMKTAEASRQAWDKIALGTVGLVGAGVAVTSALDPAIEMNRVLGDASAAGVGEDALKSVRDAALDFSSTYGTSAVEFVESNEKMRSSVSGLSTDELIDFSSAANLLAVSTKSGVDETTTYLSQMYNRFKDTADDIGKVEFVDNLVAQTSYLKKQVGVDAMDIADAMKGLNNLGSGLGVGMDEQLAVLATLNRTTGIEPTFTT